MQPQFQSSIEQIHFNALNEQTGYNQVSSSLNIDVYCLGNEPFQCAINKEAHYYSYDGYSSASIAEL